MKALTFFTLATFFLNGTLKAESFSIKAVNKSLSTIKASSTTADVSESIAVKGETRFQTLKNWFSQGRRLNYAQVKGFYSGRCFVVNEQNKPAPVMLSYLEEKVGEDAGPGFPNSIEKNIFVATFESKSPDYFDSESRFQQNRAEIESVARYEWTKMKTTENENTITWYYDWEPNGNFDEKNEFVVYNDYIVQRGTALIKQEYGRNVGVKNPGDDLLMCYYFKQLDK
jgi:hypothetical protein